MALGEQLRKARMARNETPAQIAAATQVGIQIIEDIEREEFGRVSAPIYAKGFIKLYARHVGLDPQPLIEEYMARFAHASRPPWTKTQPRGQEEQQESQPAGDERRQADTAPIAGATTTESRPVPKTIPPSSPAAEPPEPAAAWDGLSGVRSVAADIASTTAGALKRAWASAGAGRRSTHEGAQRHAWIRNRPAGSFLKYIPIAIGILLILVFLISSFSRVFARKPKLDTPVPLNESKEEVRLVIDPPAPYSE